MADLIRDILTDGTLFWRAVLLIVLAGIAWTPLFTIHRGKD